MKCKYCGGKLVKKQELEEVWVNVTFATHETVYKPHYVWEHEDDVAAYNAQCPRFYKECRRIPWDEPYHSRSRWNLGKVYDEATEEWSDYDDIV